MTNLSIAERIMHQILNMPMFEQTFKTSLDTIAEVMGVPRIAVLSIAKSANISVGDFQSECIDENSLGVFEDAYVRKLRAFFRAMLRDNSHVGYDDLAAFNKFCKTFKKPGYRTTEVTSWEQIDEESIRHSFRAQIRKQSSQTKRPHAIIDLFSGLSTNFDLSASIQTISVSELAESDQEFETKHAEVLNNVTQTAAYRYLAQKPKVILPDRVISVIRVAMLSARYHIFSRSDKEDHHEETVFFEGRFDQSLNSTLKMVS